MNTYDNKKTKILLISPLPPPSGGIATWSKSVLNTTPNYGQVEVIHLDTAVRWRSTNDLSFFQRILGGAFQAFRDFFRLYLAIKKSRPQLIHLCSSASMATPKDILMLSLARFLGVRSIIHYRFGRLSALIAAHSWEWRMIRVAMKLSDIVLLLDNKSKESVSGALPEVSVELIPNPIDMTMLNELIFQGGKKRQATTSPFSIVYAGHVVPAKGIRELVEACTFIDAYSFELHLVGTIEDDFREELEKIALKGNGGQWLYCHGTLPHREAMICIRDADIFVLPSYTEGFPNVVLEAMAMGTPIIATRVGALPEMLDDNSGTPCGLLIEPRDVEELRGALIDFMEHPDMACACGIRAQKKAMECYGMDNVMEQYVKLWCSLADNV